jgi:hypothetical protein
LDQPAFAEEQGHSADAAGVAAVHWDTMVAYWDHDDTRFDTNHLEWQPVVSKSRRETDTLEDIREVLTGRRR